MSEQIKGNNQFFPPIVDTYVPAFTERDFEQGIKIPFFVSNLNSFPSCQMEVSIRDQRTNQSILTETDNSNITYKVETGLFDIEENKAVLNQGFVKIFPSAQSGINKTLSIAFETNVVYKVQMRFSNGQVGLSEWSTICLLRQILLPKVYLDNFSTEGGASLDETTPLTWSSPVLRISGKLKFFEVVEKTDEDKIEYIEIEQKGVEKDALESYQLQLIRRKEESQEKIEDKMLEIGDLVYTNKYQDPNTINYTFKHKISPCGLKGTDNDTSCYYICLITYTTRNGYTQTQTFKIIYPYPQGIPDQPPVALEAHAVPEAGCIEIFMKPKIKTDEDNSPNALAEEVSLVYRRASSKTDFAEWEKIREITRNKTPWDEDIWCDYTIESGVWYKYEIAIEKNDNSQKPITGVQVQIEEPLMILFEDMFLDANKTQLRIQFNPQVSSYKKNVSEAKIDTIGSTFPFIKRNGAIGYRQFSLSGMISIQNDFQNMFIERKTLYDNSDNNLLLYQAYNEENIINDFNDHYLERKYREKVIEFLYENNVKLLRTLPEGNILVKLMDISLSPEQGLGRMLYNFSATAYEVDDCTLEHLIEHNIYDYSYTNVSLRPTKPIPPPSEIFVDKEGELEGWYGDTALEEVPIMDKLLKIHSRDLPKDHMIEIQYLSSFRIEFKTPPYLIDRTGVDPVPLDTLPVDKITKEKLNRAFLGHILNLEIGPFSQPVKVLVGVDGIYELGENIEIKNISFPKKEFTNLKYNVHYKERIVPKKLTAEYSYGTKLNQLWGSFKAKESLLPKVQDKVNYQDETFKIQLLSIDGLKVEAPEGSVFWVFNPLTTQRRRFVINNQEFLSLYDDKLVILDFMFGGHHLEECPQEISSIEAGSPNSFKYFINMNNANTVYNRPEDIEHPVLNGVYTFETKVEADLIRPEGSDTGYGEKDVLEKEETNIQNILLTNKVLNSYSTQIYYNGRWYPFDMDTKDVLCPTDGLIEYLYETQKEVYSI